MSIILTITIYFATHTPTHTHLPQQINRFRQTFLQGYRPAAAAAALTGRHLSGDPMLAATEDRNPSTWDLCS